MDSDVSEKIPESMEVGMLGLVRKLIMLMPDNMVRRVVGQIVQHESLIAIANDHNIVVRTAVIRVSVWVVRIYALPSIIKNGLGLGLRPGLGMRVGGTRPGNEGRWDQAWE